MSKVRVRIEKKLEAPPYEKSFNTLSIFTFWELGANFDHIVTHCHTRITDEGHGARDHPECALAQWVVAVYQSGAPPFALRLLMGAVTHRKASTGSW